MSQNILIVDDEINSLKVLSTALKREKFSIDTAMSGEDAWDMIQKTHYNLVLSDYKLPGINGEMLLEKIKGYDSQITVILITAFGSIDLAVNAMKKGGLYVSHKADKS